MRYLTFALICFILSVTLERSPFGEDSPSSPYQPSWLTLAPPSPSSPVFPPTCHTSPSPRPSSSSSCSNTVAEFLCSRIRQKRNGAAIVVQEAGTSTRTEYPFSLDGLDPESDSDHRSSFEPSGCNRVKILRKSRSPTTSSGWLCFVDIKSCNCRVIIQVRSEIKSGSMSFSREILQIRLSRPVHARRGHVGTKRNP
jgi:hypothetical protein